VSAPRSRRARLAPIGLALALALAAPALAGCTEVESESASGYEPSELAKARVRFTAEAARRTGLRTAAVRRSGETVAVPYAALLYGPDGSTYVYTSSRPLEYVRARVRVARIEGDRVVLARGPAPGTRVVTVGAAEVYGTELEVPAK
jgi:hypothetical protein